MGNNPIISIIHPSYKRPELAAKCVKMWLDRCKDKSRVEYVLCLSEQDDVLSYLEELNKVGIGIECVVCPEANMVKQIAFAVKKAKGNILANVSDDFECPQDWDQLLLEALEGKEDYVVKTQDGIQPFIMTLPIMDRKYFDRFGYIFHPDYNHMYADNELADVGQILGRTITLDILFPHNHYSVGKMERDEVNNENDSFYGVDHQTYSRRKAINFDLN